VERTRVLDDEVEAERIEVERLEVRLWEGLDGDNVASDGIKVSVSAEGTTVWGSVATSSVGEEVYPAASSHHHGSTDSSVSLAVSVAVPGFLSE